MTKLYTVDDVTERTTISRAGLIQKVYRVTATSQSGTIFSVEIPEADFNKEKVDHILTEKASLIEGVKKL
jgi:hypothetical protein